MSCGGGVVFSFDTCLQRVKARKIHPTLQGTSDNCAEVVENVANSFEFPTREEGFSYCRVIRDDKDIVRVLAELTMAQ